MVMTFAAHDQYESHAPNNIYLHVNLGFDDLTACGCARSAKLKLSVAKPERFEIQVLYHEHSLIEDYMAHK